MYDTLVLVLAFRSMDGTLDVGIRTDDGRFVTVEETAFGFT